MNLLHITPYYAPAYAYGGVVRAVEGMTRALARRGHIVTVLTTDALDHQQRYSGPREEMRDGVHVIRARNLLPGLRAKANLGTPLAMRGLAMPLLRAADVVHLHEFRTLENLLVTPAAARLNKPMVLSPHGTLSLHTGRGGLKGLWDRWLSPMVARRLRLGIGLTANEAEEIRRLWQVFGLTIDTAVIPNGIDPDEYANSAGGDAFRARYHLAPDALVVLFMARLHSRKGIEALLQGFQQANIPSARLVIAGPDEGMLERLKAIADERVIFTGYLGGADRLAALAAADVFALPAVGEGLPMGVLEAMGAGVPVLISPGCNLPEVAEASAGLIVEPTPDRLGGALRSLLEDRARRQVMSAAAVRLVRERFTWDAVAEGLEAQYQKVESRKGKV